MDPVFDAQFLRMKDPFNDAGYRVAVAYTRAGEFDYVYQVDVLLAREANVPQLRDVLPRLRRDHARPQPAYGDLVLLPIGGDGHHDDDGHLTVPEALDLIERRVGRERMHADGEPLATAAHIVHTAKLCSATEPEVPGGPAPAPYPPPAAPGTGQENIKLGISDTGLWEQPSPDLHPWLAGVVGVADPPGPALASGQLTIPYEGGHGTMVAGMARCMAPGANVYVGNHLPYSGGTLEYMLARDLEGLIAGQSPDLINLSAGGYTRGDVPPLSFIEFRRGIPTSRWSPRPATTARTGGSGPRPSTGRSPSARSAPICRTWPGSATTAAGWTSTRSAKAWSTRSPPACTTITCRRNSRPRRSSTGWPGGRARRLPRRWSPGSS